MRESVQFHIQHCEACQFRKPPNKSDIERTTDISFAADYPLEIVSWDIMGPIQASAAGNRYIVVVEDIFSRWVEAFPLPETSAASLADILWSRFFSKYDPPRRLHSDQGRNLNAEVIQELCRFWGVKRSNTVAYHPQGNGLVERMNRTLQAVIATKKQDNTGKDWDELLPAATYAYNVTPQTTTGK